MARCEKGKKNGKSCGTMIRWDQEDKKGGDNGIDLGWPHTHHPNQ